jgi:hypothetical protein
MTNWLTHQDVDNYGPELIDVTQRAALHAVTPHLQKIAEDNLMLHNRLAAEARRSLDLRVERAVPNYREIDRMPEWHRWLLGIDTLSGRVRQLLLNEAISSGSEARIAAFFRKFQQEAGGAQAQASGRTRAPVGQRTYTRAQIAALYEAHRKGHYANREAEWQRIEADIFDAQKTGRIQAFDYITK